MNKRIVGILAVLVLLSVVVAWQMQPESFGGLIPEGILESPLGNPVFCNDYEFTCCVEQEEYRDNFDYFSSSNTGRQYFLCPSWASNCEVHINSLTRASEYSGNFGYYLASIDGATPLDSGCTFCSSCWLGQDRRFSCSGEQQYFNTGTRIIEPGEMIYTSDDMIINGYALVYSDVLLFTGTSGAIVGIPVPGSDGCKFVTNEDIYGENGNLVRNVENSDVSYTVERGFCSLSFPRGSRHICGYENEQCSSNSDCSMGHTYSYAYQGQTYGAECYARSLQLYGCERSDTEVCEDQLGGNCIDDSERITVANSRCEAQIILGSEYGIECCPGSDDCGINGVCNPTTFKCEAPEDVQCYRDTDCGRTIDCNREDMTLEQWICVNPGSINSYCDKEILEEVDCCVDNDCPSGWYCDSDKTCKQGAADKDDCPFACCVDNSNYFDKPCAAGSVCCPADSDKPNSCADSLAECTGGDIIPSPIPDTTYYYMFALVGFLLGFVGGLKVFKRPEYSSKPFYKQSWFIGALILGLIGAIALYLLAPSLISFATAIFPTFQCGIDIGCYVFDLVKLLAWLAIFVVIIKLT